MWGQYLFIMNQKVFLSIKQLEINHPETNGATEQSNTL